MAFVFGATVVRSRGNITTCRVGGSGNKNNPRVEIVDSKGERKMRIADRFLLASAKVFFDEYDAAPSAGGELDVFPCDGSSGACYLTSSGMVFKMDLENFDDSNIVQIDGQTTLDVMNAIKKDQEAEAENE